MSRRRTSAIAVLLGAALVVAAPTAAFAYWVASTQTAIAATSATFAVSAPSSVAGASNVLQASSADLSGFSGSTVSSAVYTNTGATPWTALDVTAATTASFGAGATATTSAAVVAASAACSTVTEYSAVTVAGVTLSVSVAPGASAKVCVLTEYDRLSVQNRTTSSGIQVVVSPRRENWTVASTALAISTTAPNAGLMSCSDSGSSNAKLTFVVPQDGTYRWVDTSTGTGTAFVASAAQSRTFTTQFLGTTGQISVTVQRQTGSAWTTVAQGSVVGSGVLVLWAQYRCA